MIKSNLFLLIAMLLVGSCYAAITSVTIPNTFTASTKAEAAKVNANFTAVTTGVNNAISAINTAAGSMPTLDARLDVLTNNDGTLKAQAVDLGAYNFTTTGTVSGSNLVYKTTNQTIAGEKTFTNYIYASGGIDVVGTSYFNGNIWMQSNGGVKESSYYGFLSTTLPTCDGLAAGQMRYNSTGADTVQICMEDGAGNYSWRSMDTTASIPYTGATGAVNLGSHNLTTAANLNARIVKLADDADETPCNSGNRGSFRMMMAPLGSADELQFCAKSSANNYSWRPITLF